MFWDFIIFFKSKLVLSVTILQDLSIRYPLDSGPYFLVFSPIAHFIVFLLFFGGGGFLNSKFSRNVYFSSGIFWLRRTLGLSSSFIAFCVFHTRISIPFISLRTFIIYFSSVFCVVSLFFEFLLAFCLFGLHMSR